jgi:hypothetical protein
VDWKNALHSFPERAAAAAYQRFLPLTALLLLLLLSSAYITVHQIVITYGTRRAGKKFSRARFSQCAIAASAFSQPDAPDFATRLCAYQWVFVQSLITMIIY